MQTQSLDWMANSNGSTADDHLPRGYALALPNHSTGSAVTSETRYLSADTPTGDFKVVFPRIADVDYSVDHHPGPDGAGADWFLISFRDAARPNSELMVAPVADPTATTVGFVVVGLRVLLLVAAG